MGAALEKMPGHRIQISVITLSRRRECLAGRRAGTRLPQPPRRDQVVQDMPCGIAKGTAASAGQVLDFDLFLGRHAADLVKLMDGGGIVHAA